MTFENKAHSCFFRKQSGLSLVEELVARGGETEKYNLFPPSGQQ